LITSSNLLDGKFGRMGALEDSGELAADALSCPWCGEPMWLVRVVETGPHFSERRFECATCEMTKNVRVHHPERPLQKLLRAFPE
jgi:C4-type Zn-finger protein